jgi:elongation factor P
MISSNDIRPGKAVVIDGNPHQVLEFLHVKPGKGAAFVRTKLRNLATGGNLERTFRAGEMLPVANIEKRGMQYMYEASGEYNFMDQETFDQVVLSKQQLGDSTKWLKEGMQVEVLFFEETKVIGVDIPNMVELEVVETDPGVRGDTATGGSKPAKMETGAIVGVPFFINQGEKIRIDTRTGEYLGRA